MHRFFKRALVAVASFGLFALPMATPAQADTTMDSAYRQVEFADHFASVRTYKESGTNKLYSIVNITTDDVPQNHCVEVYTNVNLILHRSPDLTVLCRTFSSLSNIKIYLRESTSGGPSGWATEDDWNEDVQHKGVKICVVDQAYLHRDEEDTQMCSQGWWGEGEADKEDATQPNVHQYDYSTYHDMATGGNGIGGLNTISSINGIADQQWGGASNVYLNQNSMWTSWGCNPHNGCDSRYLFVFQADGNLVMYSVNTIPEPVGLTAVWASGTNGWNYADLVIQTDGNMVIYGDPSVDSQCVWHTNLAGLGIIKYSNIGGGQAAGYTAGGTQYLFNNHAFC